MSFSIFTVYIHYNNQFQSILLLQKETPNQLAITHQLLTAPKALGNHQSTSVFTFCAYSGIFI